MAVAAWPGLLLMAATWTLAFVRVRALAWRAPVDADALARELTRRIERRELARTLALCDALRPAWAAELAARALRATWLEDQRLAMVLQELEAEYAHVAERSSDLLGALARIAIPLALGAAIVALSLGFAANAGSGVSFDGAERALQSALQALTLGIVTTVFGKLVVSSLQRAAAARLAELRSVAAALLQAQLQGLGKYSA